MILNLIKLIILYLCLKPWNTYTKFFFINTTLILSYQTSWYVLLGIYLNLFIFSSFLPHLEQLFQKELFDFLKFNDWVVSEQQVKYLFPYVLRQYSLIFFFKEKVQGHFFVYQYVSLSENYEKLSKLFLKETIKNQWLYLISFSEDSKAEYSDQLFNLNSFWDLKELPESGLKNYVNNPNMVKIISQNLLNNNLQMLKSFSFNEKEINQLFEKNPYFFKKHFSFINDKNADEFLREISGQKKILFLKNRIKNSLIFNLENTFKILNLVYLFDLNIDVALNSLEQESKTSLSIDKMFSWFEKLKVSIVKKILKSRYTDKKILDLLTDTKINQINLSLILTLTQLWRNDLPDKVKTLSDFNTHENNINTLKRWAYLNIPKNGIEQQIAPNFFYKNSFYHIHFLKNVEEFYSAGVALQNCLYNHDFFYKTYDGRSSVFLIKDEQYKPILAVEIDYKGKVIQASGVNYAINSDPNILNFVNGLKPQNILITYCNAMYQKIFLFFWSIGFNLLKRAMLMYKIVKIALL